MSDRVFEYALDGLVFSVRVYEDGGEIKADVTVEEGHADFNAIYWGNDTAGDSAFGGFGKKDGALNMNGSEGSTHDGQPVEWDGAVKLSRPGLGKDGTSKDTYVAEGETETFVLTGAPPLDEIDFLGIRATTTSTPAGSIKAISVPTDDPPVNGDDFPEWAQDISHATFVFNQDAGDVTGDGYYSVKIDNWPDAADDDLDNSIDDILAYLIANDTFIVDDSTLEGVVIKGGQQTTEFYAYGANNTNGTDPDPLPPGLGFSLPGDSGNESPPSAIDTSVDYGTIL